MSTSDRPPDRYQELFGVSAAELRRRGVDPDDYAFQREREGNKASSRVFSDFNLPPTPNWRLRGFLALLAIAIVGWLLNVVQIFHTVNSASGVVGLAILTPPAGFTDEPNCDATDRICYERLSAVPVPLDSAAAAALVRSFGVVPDTPTCSTVPAETCSGIGPVAGSDAFTPTRTDVTVRFTITTGYLTAGSAAGRGLAVRTEAEFTVTGGG
jgi:hypothetical protein